MTIGKFITIEGSEGAGKSTAINYIKAYFDKLKLPVIYTREPGGTPFAEEVRSLLLKTGEENPISANAELLLMFAGREDHLKTKIIPALAEGHWVVSDRFTDATYAYQGGGRGLDIDKIKYLDEWIVGHYHPDLTILLDIPENIGRERANNRGQGQDRIEAEPDIFFKNVRQAYLDRAKSNPDRIKIIDATQSIEQVEQQINAILNKFIEVVS